MRTDSGHREAAVDALLEMGGRAVQETPESVVTHLTPPDDLDATLSKLRRRLLALGIPDPELVHAWQPHEAWEKLWKQGLGLRRVTDRIGVLPSWCSPEESLPEITIVIDPGMAFGTAEHATTRGSLRLLDQAVSAADRILDAGAGSAILSIAAAKLGAKQVTAVELDPYACEAARDNVRRNGARGVDVVQAEITPGWLAAAGSFDGIVANMQTGIILPLLRPFRRALAEHGWLIVSGVLADEWPRIQAAAAGSGLSLVSVDAEEEWRSAWFSAEI